MKKTIIAISLIAIGSSLSSCVKSYECLCTDTAGKKTTETVNATNKVQARQNCDKLDIRGNCELQ